MVLSTQNTLVAQLLVGLTTISGVVLIGFHNPTWGWPLLAAAFVASLWYRKSFGPNYLSLAIVMLAVVGITPINTKIDYGHMLLMGSLLGASVAIPYYVSRFIKKDNVVSLPFRQQHRWHKYQVLYIVITATIAYLLLPFYLASTGSYLNWTVDPGASNLIRLFIGTNALGIWDELFFVGVILAIFRRYVPFWYANVAQAALWVAFLYELGFRGWGPVPLFIFALSQGYIFRRTKSLLYVIAIHLTLDFILYLALIHAHHPSWMPVFLIT